MVRNEDGSVTLTAEEYEDLTDDQDWLYAIESAGVDNWDGYSYAREIYEEQKGGSDD